MSGRSARVVFDFDGALQVARHSWQTADALDRLAAARRDDAEHAAVGWSGAYGVEFALRVDAELQGAATVAMQLRGEAEGWALEWTYAVEQENWHRYQDACDRVRDDRSLLEGVTGFFFGHDDLPPEPRAVATPQPPGFAATARLVDYSRF